MNVETFRVALKLLQEIILAWIQLKSNETNPVVSEPEQPPIPPVATPTEEPTPVIPEPNLIEAPNPKHYVQKDKRGEWVAKLFHAYSVWRGEREYGALLRDGNEYFKGGAKELLPYTEVQIRQFMGDAIDAHARSERLQWRIENEEHRAFEDRMQVKKSKVNQMYHELLAITDQYHRVAAHFPHVRGCDSIACKLEKGF